MSIIDRKQHYTLPLHEFVRAVVYGDTRHYAPQGSPVMNAFDISSSDPREHFLALLMLAHIDRAGQLGETDGFADLPATYNFLQAWGFTPEQITSAYDRCAARGLLETNGATRRSKVRITTSGAYMHKRLAAMFTYIDAIVVDTPIVGSEFRHRIGDVESIHARTERALLFLSSHLIHGPA